MEEAPDRGPTEAQLARDGRLTQAGGRKPLHIRSTVGDTRRSAMAFTVAPSLRNAGFDALTQNLPLKLRKDREEAGHGPARGRREIQGFVERDKPHPQGVELVRV